jgi:PAS domain S-box-containing protein
VAGVNHRADVLRILSPPKYKEFALLGLGIVAATVVMFDLSPQAIDRFPVLIPLPFLLWAAMRFGPGGLSLLFLSFTPIAVIWTTSGNGPFVSPSTEESVVRLQVFLLALYIPLLLLASVVEERRTERKALRQSEARYRAVVEDQTEFVCRFNSDGTHTFVNEAYCRHFGRSRTALLGRRIWDVVPPREHQALREALALLTPARPVANRQQEVVAATGEVRRVQWRDRGLFDNDGRILEYQTVGHDLTEHKRLKEATHRLAHAGRLAVAGELTASIAHELNQPLGAILNNVETAEHLLHAERPSLEEMRAILADIRYDDVRTSKIIRRLQDLLRKRETVMVPLDINEIVNEVVGLISSDARRRGGGVDAELGSNVPGVLGDHVHIQQVLLNLLLNAMDAMGTTPQAQRRIVVRTESDGNLAAKVSISDAGHGIPPDKIGTVFESFFTTKESGMGLGLAIARSIIDLHGGRIWASNNLLAGTTFHFVLPANPQLEI